MANERAQALHAAQNLFKIPELKSKILFTLMCLAVYRLGSHIPTAGVNILALQQMAGQFEGTLFGIYDLFTGGALQRATVFALGIMPYISASIVFQVLGSTFPTIEKLQKEPGVVVDPGWGFRLETVLLLTSGGVFVMWLGEQITERGIGNGMSLLIFFSIIQGFPAAVFNTLELLRAGGSA